MADSKGLNLALLRNYNSMWRIEMADCSKCVNRVKTNGLSQESFCSSCVHQESWRVDHFKAREEGWDFKNKPTLDKQ